MFRKVFLDWGRGLEFAFTRATHIAAFRTPQGTEDLPQCHQVPPEESVAACPARLLATVCHDESFMTSLQAFD